MTMRSYASILFILITAPTFCQGVAAGIGSVFTHEATGMNGRLYYFPDDIWCFGVEGSFFPSVEDTEVSFNVHRLIEIERKFSLYPVAGLRWSERREEEGFIEAVDDGVSVNLGLGLHVPLGRFVPFTEYIYGIGFADEGSVMLGTFFILKEKGKF